MAEQIDKNSSIQMEIRFIEQTTQHQKTVTSTSQNTELGTKYQSIWTRYAKSNPLLEEKGNSSIYFHQITKSGV
jgi:hypothetical protein